MAKTNKSKSGLNYDVLASEESHDVWLIAIFITIQSFIYLFIKLENGLNYLSFCLNYSL